MNGIRIFNSPQFGVIRTAGTSEQPLFCLADVCHCLGLSAKGVNQRLGDEVISNYPIVDNLGRTQQALFVNEDGLYDVILDSRKPQAKAFRKWVTSEVLPAIRKTGGYIATRAEDTPEEIMARALTIAQATLAKRDERLNLLEAENEKQKRQITEEAPRVLFSKAVETSKRSCLIGELAKILQQNGINIGQNRLFKWLRENGYLCNKGEMYNQPTQKAMELGLFEIKQTVINMPDGSVVVKSTTKTTGKGQVYFVNKFLGCENLREILGNNKD